MLVIIGSGWRTEENAHLVDIFSVLCPAWVAQVNALNADFSNSLKTREPSQPSTLQAALVLRFQTGLEKGE